MNLNASDNSNTSDNLLEYLYIPVYFTKNNILWFGVVYQSTDLTEKYPKMKNQN